MSAQIEIRLKRGSKVYQEGDLLCGLVVLTSRSDFRHEGIVLSVEGEVCLTHTGKSAGIVDAFYNTPKSIKLLSSVLDLAESGRLPSGTTEIPFEVPLEARLGKPLYETYHGLYINIQYTVSCDIRRGVLSRDSRRSVEFMLELRRDSAAVAVPHALNFLVTPENLVRTERAAAPPPRFQLRGRLESVECPLSAPLLGQVTLERCDVPVQSVELQLVRTETCGRQEALSRQSSEVQNIQIGLGDVPRRLPIPIYMVFPRLFTCASVSAQHFQVEFSVNVVVIFRDEHLVSENIPLKLTRY